MRCVFCKKEFNEYEKYHVMFISFSYDGRHLKACLPCDKVILTDAFIRKIEVDELKEG